MNTVKKILSDTLDKLKDPSFLLASLVVAVFLAVLVRRFLKKVPIVKNAPGVATTAAVALFLGFASMQATAAPDLSFAPAIVQADSSSSSADVFDVAPVVPMLAAAQFTPAEIAITAIILGVFASFFVVRRNQRAKVAGFALLALFAIVAFSPPANAEVLHKGGNLIAPQKRDAGSFTNWPNFGHSALLRLVNPHSPSNQFGFTTNGTVFLRTGLTNYYGWTGTLTVTNMSTTNRLHFVNGFLSTVNWTNIGAATGIDHTPGF